MRPIKFRAWNIRYQKMFTVTHLDLNSMSGYVDFEGNEGDVWEAQFDGENQDHILMQYTGIKDKNGKEIYEGDIVKSVSTEFINENFTAEVIYDDCHFSIKVSNLYNVSKNNCKSLNSNMEVIGNTYEYRAKALSDPLGSTIFREDPFS